MKRIFIGAISAGLALLVCATGLIASTMEPVSAQTPGTAFSASFSSDINSSGMILALLCIALGSGMVFVFRPRRSIY